MRGLLAALLLGLASLLASCGKTVESCSSQSTQQTVLSIVKEQLEKSAKERVKAEAPGRPVSNSKIRATIGQLKIAVADIRTTKEDPNSTKRFCVGNLRVTLPSVVVEDADEARELAGIESVSALADQREIERNADTFETSLDFNVQPTDAGDDLYGEIENGENAFQFFGEVLASHLLKATIQNAKFDQDQAAAARQREEVEAERAQQAAVVEQGQAEIAEAKSENKLASDAINAVWRNIPAGTRGRLSDLQKAWMRKKNADYVIEAATSTSTAPAREAARLRCDTRAVYERASNLRQFVGEEPSSDSSTGNMSTDENMTMDDE